MKTKLSFIPALDLCVGMMCQSLVIIVIILKKLKYTPKSVITNLSSSSFLMAKLSYLIIDTRMKSVEWPFSQSSTPLISVLYLSFFNVAQYMLTLVFGRFISEAMMNRSLDLGLIAKKNNNVLWT